MASILIVEPGDDERELYAEYFAWAGFHVEVATGSAEAYRKCLRLRPDVVTTALDLRDGSGADLCARLKTHVRTRHIPVVVVTARAFHDDRARAERAGADAIFMKPCLPGDLLARARELVTTGKSDRQKVGPAPRSRAAKAELRRRPGTRRQKRRSG